MNLRAIAQWLRGFLTSLLFLGIGVTVALTLGSIFRGSASTPVTVTSAPSLPQPSFLADTDLGSEPILPTASAPALVRGKVESSVSVVNPVNASGVGAWKPRKQK